MTDEVARNGALRERLRPEVFADAPLHFPQRILSPKKFTPSPNPSIQLSQRQPFPGIDSRLAQHFGHGIVL